jgi:hypothetical protein
MYESYALVKKADCLVANGHVTMANSPAVVVRNPDGTINGEESYIMQCEQGLFNNTDAYKRTSADGTEYRITPGTLFMTGPGIAHEQVSLASDPMTEYCIYFQIETSGKDRTASFVSSFLKHLVSKSG